ncbi:hypothetical protein [Streptomyces sp. NPDC047009]|uniref:hypothetical protein n=1 Tax=Streptomyces sp. NPDC047009 TaxID=3154496 RepID=UPI003409A484
MTNFPAVIASRLTEDLDVTVAVIEGGPSDAGRAWTPATASTSGPLLRGQRHPEDVLGEPGRGVTPQLGRAACVELHHDPQVQERAVVELAELLAPLIGGSVQQPTGELRSLHGQLRDPVRAYPGTGGGSERGAPGERRQISHGRTR